MSSDFEALALGGIVEMFSPGRRRRRRLHQSDGPPEGIRVTPCAAKVGTLSRRELAYLKGDHLVRLVATRAEAMEKWTRSLENRSPQASSSL